MERAGNLDNEEFGGGIVGEPKGLCKPGPRNEGRGPQTTSSSDVRCVRGERVLEE